jgi:CRISPR-associated protein Csm5
MKFSEPIKIKAEVVTPIHIGSGEEIKPISYVTDKEFVYMVDYDKFISCLTEREQEAYQKWVEEITGELVEIKKKLEQAGPDFQLKRELNRKRREIEEKLSLYKFLKEYLKKDNPVNFIIKNAEAYRVKYLTNLISRGFKSCIRNSQGLPYIPGSEIKGSIRTSIIYYLLAHQKYEILSQKLISLRDTLEKGAFREKLNKILSISDDLEKELLRGNKADAKYDFLKFVAVKDSEFLKQSDVTISSSYSVGTDRYTTMCLETLVPGTKVNFEIALAEDLMTNFRWVLEKLRITPLKEWLTIDKIFEGIYFRSRSVLEEEIHFFSENQGMKNLLNHLKEKNTLTTPLLRIGAGQGFLSTTVTLLVKDRDKKLYEESVRQAVSFLKRWRTQPYNFPKTRKVVEEKEEARIMPLGWLRLSK